MVDFDDIDRDWYVYVHKEKASGKVFYVGKGRGKRAFSKSGRNRLWHERVESLAGEYGVELLNGGLGEEDALNIESEYIHKHGIVEFGGQLVNRSLGESLDGGFGVLLSINLPDLTDQYASIEFRKLEKSDQIAFCDEIISKMRGFESEYDALTDADCDDDDDDKTDLEFELGSTITSTANESKHRKKRQITYRDYCCRLNEAGVDLADCLDDADSQSDRIAIRELARRVVEYMREKNDFLRMLPMPDET